MKPWSDKLCTHIEFQYNQFHIQLLICRLGSCIEKCTDDVYQTSQNYLLSNQSPFFLQNFNLILWQINLLRCLPSAFSNTPPPSLKKPKQKTKTRCHLISIGAELFNKNWSFSYFGGLNDIIQKRSCFQNITCYLCSFQRPCRFHDDINILRNLLHAVWQY